MPADVIVETDVSDPEQYERYKAAVAASGGRYLVRGGKLAVLEGDWRPSRLVVLEFEDLAAARSWYASARYQEAKGLRQGGGAAPHGGPAGRRLPAAVIWPVAGSDTPYGLIAPCAPFILGSRSPALSPSSRSRC